jgi:hypothetical protein
MKIKQRSKPTVASTPAQSQQDICITPQSSVSSLDGSERSQLLAPMDRCASNTTDLLKLQQNSYSSDDFFDYIKKCARNRSPALLDEY